MLVLVGPSASGKSAIVKKLVSDFNMQKFITCTTRSPRVGEVDKVDYYFMSKEEFDTRYTNDEFIETVYYNGNHYGTLKSEAAMDKVVILEPNGLNNFIEKNIDLFSVFLHTDEQKLKDRMLFRGDSMPDVLKRLENDKISFNKDALKDVNLVVDTSDLSISEIAAIIYKNYIKYCGK